MDLVKKEYPRFPLCFKLLKIIQPLCNLISSKKFLLMFLFAGFSFGCRSPVLVQQPKNPVVCRWMERSGAGYDSPTNCFTGFTEIQNNLSEIDLKIYDRFGNVIFETTRLNENWFCNDTRDTNCVEGTYYYVLNFREKGDTTERLVSSFFEIKKQTMK